MDCSRNFKCVRYFPKDIYLRATSEVTIFHVAASQMCNFPSGNFPKVRLGPLRRSRLQCEPSTADRFGWGTKRCSQNRLRLRTAARIHLGSYRMGNCTFGKLPHGENTLEKLPLGTFVWKKDIPHSQQNAWTLIWAIAIIWKITSFFYLEKCSGQFYKEPTVNIFKRKIHEYLIQSWSKKAFKGTIVNLTYHHYINGRSLEITFTVLLNPFESL